MKKLLPLVLCCLLAACGESNIDDLKEFVKTSGDNLRGKVEPFPEVKPYEPFTYDAFDITDPFNPRKIEVAKGKGGGGLQPDMTRRKEVLESYPLEGLKMVGSLQMGGVIYAVIQAPDGNLQRVRPGNYLGQNFGKITEVSDREVKIEELVQDSAGDWTKRSASLTLVE